MSVMTDRKLTGSSGEHYVCYALARQGWVASLTRDGLERSDILAVNVKTRRMVEVQVKAAVPAGKPMWMLGTKGLMPAVADHEWYVFVALAGNVREAPRCFVVPRDHVAAATWVVHQNWLTDPEVKPGQRNTPVSQARVNVDIWHQYEDRWDLLPHSTDAAPVLLPPWIRKRAQEDRVGLPEGHPWRKYLPEW
jgi:hypothetical protein